MATSQEIQDFNLVRAQALQELDGYMGARAQFRDNKSGASSYDSTTHKGQKFYLRAGTEAYRKPELTKERIKNIIDVKADVNKINVDGDRPIIEAYTALRQQLHKGLVDNKNISGRFNKQHTSLKEGKQNTGSWFLGFFRRTRYQANSDQAFYRSMGIVDVAVKRAEASPTIRAK